MNHSKLPEDYGTALDYILDTAFPDSHPFLGQAVSELEELRTYEADYHRLRAQGPIYRNCRDCAAWHQERIDADGECRRFAPRLPKKDYYKLWPMTSGRDGCFDSLPKDPPEVARK